MPVRVVLGRVTTLENIFVHATLRNLRLLKQKFALLSLLAVTLASAVCAGIGVYMIGDIEDSNGALSQKVVAGSVIIAPAAYMMLILGLSGFFAGIYGCFALCQRKRFQFLVFLFGAVEVCFLAFICFILALLFFANVKSQVREKALASFLEDYSKGDEERISKVWHPLQQSLRCCGVRSYDDYQLTAKKTTADVGMVDVPIPRSCCVSQKNIVGEPVNINLCKLKRSRYIFTHGCGEFIEKALTQNSGLILVASIFIILIEVAAGYVVRRIFLQLPIAEDPTLAPEPPLPSDYLFPSERTPSLELTPARRMQYTVQRKGSSTSRSNE